MHSGRRAAQQRRARNNPLMDRREFDQTYQLLCTGHCPSDVVLIAFCRDATVEQLELVLLRASPINVRNLHWVEKELEKRRHVEAVQHAKAASEKLEEATRHLQDLKKSNWIARWTLLFTAAALAYAYCSWRFPKQSPLSYPAASQASQAALQHSTTMPPPLSASPPQPATPRTNAAPAIGPPAPKAAASNAKS